MAERFLTFQKFSDAGLANEIGMQLQHHGIPFVVEDYQSMFKPDYALNKFESDILLKIAPENFEKAHEVLERLYGQQIDGVDRGYYLFDFTDEELVEIITKPDEWGHFDYQLAKNILKERGKEISPEIAKLLRTRRNTELAKPEKSDRFWIYLGYFSAILGGLFGLVIGWTLAYFKKTLPNRSRVYVYRDEERNHGIRILIISAVSIFFWVFVRRWLNGDA